MEEHPIIKSKIVEVFGSIFRFHKESGIPDNTLRKYLIYGQGSPQIKIRILKVLKRIYPEAISELGELISLSEEAKTKEIRMIPELSLYENYRLRLAELNLTIRELCRKTGVAESTVYRGLKKVPLYPTKSAYTLGNALGFKDKEIEAAILRHRLIKGKAFGFRTRFYRLIAELNQFFEDIRPEA